MSVRLDNQRKPSSNISKFLEERFEKANLRPQLTAYEIKHLSNLELIADKLKRQEKVQIRQFEMWLSEEEEE